MNSPYLLSRQADMPRRAPSSFLPSRSLQMLELEESILIASVEIAFRSENRMYSVH